MRKNRWAKRLVLGVALVVCMTATTGCSGNKIITSIHGMTSESNALGPKFSRIYWGTQWESVSLLGLLPAPEPGYLYCYNPDRGPLSAIGIAKEESFVLTRTSGANITATEVITLRNALYAVQTATLRVAKLKLEALQARMNDAAQAKNEGKPFPVARDQATLASELLKAETELETAERKANTASQKPGILIFRWTATSTSDSSGTIADIADLGSNATTAQSGLAILGGLRDSRLYVGKDILKSWPEVNNIGVHTEWPQIPTLLIQAKHIAFLSDLNLSKTFSASLEVDDQTLGALGKNWKSLVNLELSTYQSRLEQHGATGMLSDDMTVVLQRMPWNNTADGSGIFIDGIEDRFGGTTTSDGQWHTLYHVTTPIKALKKMWKQ